ncbi:MAG: peptide chain release factor 1 [Oscillospiraceae bacterium]|jgi:peptide chain release factor 1|nr:peptide chain release factor 1 [Oscillospiraceae bacterium]
MFSKLEDLEKKCKQLEGLLYDPEVVCDQEKYKKIMKEYKSILPVVEKYQEYKKALKTIKQAKELMKSEESEKELRQMAEEEFHEAKLAAEELSFEIKTLLLPKDPDDDRNVIIEIRGGAGGEEAALFSSVLYRMYNMYADSKGYGAEILSLNETELGGFKEVSFIISGEGAFSRLKYESGVHRVQRVPETETQGRVHTSTVTVAVLPEAQDVEVDVNPLDLQIDTFRASGAGGQHINKTESAIRITHVPTGMVVECQDERSQHKNKDKAMKVLKSRLLEKKRKEQDDEMAQERRSQVGTGDRSERIRTYNYPQSRITDHRIGLTLYKLENILGGDLDELIDALGAADRASKLTSYPTDDFTDKF